MALVGVTGGGATLADYQSSEMSRDYLIDVDAVELGGSQLSDYLSAAAVTDGQFTGGIFLGGGMGHDIIVGSDGDDVLSGDSGDDVVDGYGGDDT